jgi:hypothetical protein
MSYDLYFTSPKISIEDFNSYFGGDPRYEINSGQAFYRNEHTGVYFSFDHNSQPPDDEDAIDHSVAFNINYYRPHFFALEAEPEVRRFIHHFKCNIYDYQNHGMGEGPYSREGFLKGWNHGNDFAYGAILGGDDAPSVVNSKPTEELEQIWKWNAAKHKREKETEEDIFIPLIMFMAIDGALGSVCVWPDGISTLIPYVDYLYIPRKELAPKKFLRKQEEDFCILSSADFPDFFDFYVTEDFELRASKLPSPDTPKAVKDFVMSLKKFEGHVESVGYDSILNLELVLKYQRGQQDGASNA